MLTWGKVFQREQILNPRGSSVSGNFRVSAWLMLSEGGGRVEEEVKRGSIWGDGGKPYNNLQGL